MQYYTIMFLESSYVEVEKTIKNAIKLINDNEFELISISHTCIQNILYHLIISYKGRYNIEESVKILNAI